MIGSSLKDIRRMTNPELSDFAQRLAAEIERFTRLFEDEKDPEYLRQAQLHAAVWRKTEKVKNERRKEGRWYASPGE